MSSGNQTPTFNFNVPKNTAVSITALLGNAKVTQVDIYDGNNDVWEPELASDEPMQSFVYECTSGTMQICLMGIPVNVALSVNPLPIGESICTGIATDHDGTAIVVVNWLQP